MRTAWDAPVLDSVPVTPHEMAEEVAHRLGDVTRPMVDVVRLHLEALDSALALGAPELLADQLRWQEVRLGGVSALTPEQLDAAVHAALAPYLDETGLAQVAALREAASLLGVSVRYAEHADGLPAGPAHDYLQAALAGRRDAAIKVVRDALLEDVSAEEIMLGILQPAQVELGRLWETGSISIAHEHYTTAITQLSLSLLYPRLLLNRLALDKSLVATTVGSEAHEIGIRMIADLLEQGGWQTAYLGADVPHEDVVERVAQQRADVLAVSATMAGHVREVRALVRTLRADPRCAHVRVLVGGRPFTINPGLADAVGADGWAPDARSALALCRTWVGPVVAAAGEQAG